MLDRIVDDASFSSLSNESLLTRWTLLWERRNELNENNEEEYNLENEPTIPRAPPNSPTYSIPDYSSTPTFGNGIFQSNNGGRSGNHGMEASEEAYQEFLRALISHEMSVYQDEDPVSEYRLAPMSHEISTSQAENHIEQPHSHIWESISTESQAAQPYHDDVATDDENQNSERMCDFLPIANPTNGSGPNVPEAGASVNHESTSQYSGESAEAGTNNSDVEMTDHTAHNLMLRHSNEQI